MSDRQPLDLYELLKRMRYERIDAKEISIGDPFREGTWCLERTNGRWHVFFLERGERLSEQSFTGESEACARFLVNVLRDPGTRHRSDEPTVD